MTFSLQCFDDNNVGDINNSLTKQSIYFTLELWKSLLLYTIIFVYKIEQKNVYITKYQQRILINDFNESS